MAGSRVTYPACLAAASGVGCSTLLSHSKTGDGDVVDGLPRLLVEQFDLHAADQAFAHGVVRRVADGAHAGCDAGVLESAGEGATRIWPRRQIAISSAATTPRIVMIDGKRLAELMIDHDVGVATATTYRLKRIDQDYFVESTDALGPGPRRVPRSGDYVAAPSFGHLSRWRLPVAKGS